MNAFYHQTPQSDLHILADEYVKEKDHPNRVAPIAIFHGFGDACVNPGFQNLIIEIEAGTGAPVHCIEVGAPTIGEVFNNFGTIADPSCKQVASNPDF